MECDYFGGIYCTTHLSLHNRKRTTFAATYVAFSWLIDARSMRLWADPCQDPEGRPLQHSPHLLAGFQEKRRCVERGKEGEEKIVHAHELFRPTDSVIKI